MSTDNGVIRIGRKGTKKFAFGEDGRPFEVDVVVVFQNWLCVDESFRERNDGREIAVTDMTDYHQAAVEFVMNLATTEGKENGSLTITTAESLEFLARLRDCYDEVVVFFHPKSREKQESPGSTEPELRFSVEGD